MLRTVPVFDCCVVCRASAHGVMLNNFGCPDERDGVVASIERLPDVVDFMERTIAVQFPFTSYTQVFVQALPGRPRMRD